jgi:DNA helicase-2/ATP-dependent DNA helicase PcrA
MDLSALNESQRAAVEHIHGPLLILAGAGSGKTRVITHRIAHLLERGVHGENIFALTFTNKAANEMLERVLAMVGTGRANGVTLATFHSLGVRMLREQPLAFGLESERFAILDQGDVFGIVRSLLREYGHHGADRRYDIAGIVQRMSLWKGAFIAPEAIEQEIADEYDAIAASIYGGYDDRLRSLGAVDFDDLVCLVARRLRENEELRNVWRKRVSFLLVDEYQDTNGAQFELLRQLSAAPHNLCVVGDDDQAIYGWRGAKVENILQFERYFEGTQVIKLEHNYRSRAAILHCANAVIGHNKHRHDKVLRPTRSPGDPTTVVVARDSAQEAAWVGKQIFRLANTERVPASEIAVLYRSAQQAKLIEEELQLHKLPYRLLGGQSMYDKKEVKDVLAYLKTLTMSKDELAVRRALETPSRGIGPRSMAKLVAHARRSRITLVDAASHADEIEGISGRAAGSLKRFAELIRNGQRRAHTSGDTPGALRGILDEIGFRDHVRKETGSDQATEYRMSGVEWLLGSVGRFETKARQKGGRIRWHEYFGTLSLDGSSSTSSSNETAVLPATGKITLATLHSAKGLEWQYVFIIGVEEGTMPHRRVSSPRLSDAIAGDLEEERRLFYVGITRAREALWITRSAVRIDRGRELPRAASRFLEELPSEGIQHYVIEREEELSSQAIGDMADAFLAQIRPQAQDD